MCVGEGGSGSLGPAVATVWGRAHVIQAHGVLRPGTVRLEKHRLLVAALLARVVLGPRQRGVLGHVSDDLGQFVHFVRDFIDVDATIVGFLLVITIPARVEQNAVLLVLLGVKHIVTFLAESNTHEAGLVGPVRFHSVVPPAKPSALAPPRDRSREGSDLDASPKEGRSCARSGCWWLCTRLSALI